MFDHLYAELPDTYAKQRQELEDKLKDKPEGKTHG